MRPDAIRPALWHAILIIGVGMVCGTVANLVAPARIPWVEDWSHYLEAKAMKEGVPAAGLELVRQASERGVPLLLDARPLEDFHEGHIPNAISVPYKTIDTEFENVQFLLARDQQILTYCSGRLCDDSLMLALFLRQQGFTNVAIFVGGFPEWQSAGHPIAK
jgi:rhodanese-related sulfurtransferase